MKFGGDDKQAGGGEAVDEAQGAQGKKGAEELEGPEGGGRKRGEAGPDQAREGAQEPRSERSRGDRGEGGGDCDKGGGGGGGGKTRGRGDKDGGGGKTRGGGDRAGGQGGGSDAPMQSAAAPAQTAGAPAAPAAPATPAAQLDAAPAAMATAAGGGATGFTPSSVAGGGTGVRDPAAAQANLDALKTSLAKYQTTAAASAAGYEQNPEQPDHWHNYQIYDNANGADLANPSTLMYDEAGQLTGVMIGHPAGETPPDFGAGSWHVHDGDDLQHLHVWFDKPLEEAYGQETGTV